MENMIKVKVNNKEYNIPKTTLEYYQKSLDITEKEAIDMWLTDRDIITNEEVEILTKKAKVNKTDKIVVQSKVEKAKTERKPKENPLKSAIIEDLYRHLSQNDTLFNVKVVNGTKTIDFYAENKYFSLNLVEHRPKKT